MSNLINQANLGEELVKQLNQAGIETIKELAELGCEQAFIPIKTIYEDACIK